MFHASLLKLEVIHPMLSLQEHLSNKEPFRESWEFGCYPLGWSGITVSHCLSSLPVLLLDPGTSSIRRAVWKGRRYLSLQSFRKDRGRWHGCCLLASQIYTCTGGDVTNKGRWGCASRCGSRQRVRSAFGKTWTVEPLLWTSIETAGRFAGVVEVESPQNRRRA